MNRAVPPIKPIKFGFALSPNDMSQWDENKVVPNQYAFVELICKNYLSRTNVHRDLMFAYDLESERERGCLYLGSWNDGVVE